jgi:uncharacterized protein (DUF885 family)
MTNITNLTERVTNDIEAITEVIMEQIGTKAIRDMTAEEFKLLKGICNLIDSSTALLKEYGKTIESIDKKIDALIELERS